ncbi:sensor histidine kinase [Fredinandcohnia humi]
MKRKEWLFLFYILSVTFIVATAALYILNVPVLYTEFQQVCDTCALTPSLLSELHAIDWNTSKYAVYMLFLSLSFAVGNVVLGILIFLKRPNDIMALLVALTLTSFGLSLTIAEPFHVAYPQLSFLAKTIGFISILLLGTIVCYFPDFRSAPKICHFLGIAYFIVELVNFLLSLMINKQSWHDWLPPLVEWGLLLAMGVTQIYRYRKLSSSIQRQQIKLPVFAFIITVILIIISVQIPLTTILGNLFGQTLYIIALSFIPLSFALAIIRFRLWSIDPLINRALLYGTLSLILLVVYIGVIYLLGTALQDGQSKLISLLGTVTVAVLVQPLYRRLQILINRLMYGDRQDPYAAIVRLGERLEATTSPERVLDAIVTSVRDALRLPYVALVWPNGQIAASSGTSKFESNFVDVLYQGEQVARLIIEHRDKDDDWSKEDKQVVNNLMRQAGAAIHAVGLTLELQRSRQNLVTTREDERRRLRRDLHDGLGPEIAAFSFRVATARHLLDTDSRKADSILDDLQIEIRKTVDSIRSIAYNLSPPVLDEFGLVEAVRELVRVQKGAGLDVVVENPVPLPTLDAAVEVAVYRIVQEGLANVVRHAQATKVRIFLLIEADELILKIEDNGIGLPKLTRYGVGLLSMRERAEELGGSFSIERPKFGGTILQAHIPCLKGGKDNF